MIGEIPWLTTKFANRSSSVRVPIVDPTTRSCLKKILVSSALAGASPDVAPDMTTVPPGLSELIEWDQVATPTVSSTASMRSAIAPFLQRSDQAPDLVVGELRITWKGQDTTAQPSCHRHRHARSQPEARHLPEREPRDRGGRNTSTARELATGHRDSVQ